MNRVPHCQALGYHGAALAPLMAIPRQACRPLVVALATLVLLAPALPGAPVAAQDSCLGDTEPNDAPETAPVTSGGFCLEGELAASDQDLLTWELPGGEAAGLWTVELDGVPGTLTTLRLLAISSPPGVVPVVVDRTLLTLDAPPESWGRTASDELLLPAGRLLLGVSRTDLPDGSPPPSTGYRVALRPGSALPPSGDVEPNEVPEAASPVEAAFDISGDLFGTGDLFEWRVPALDADRRWFVDLSSVLGTSVTLRLLDEEGRYLATTLTDPIGQARLVDLALAPGRYRLSVEGALDRAAPYRLRALEGDPVGDAEPNGEPSFGLAIDPSASPVVRGQLFPYGDVDRYRFTVPEGDPGLLRDIKAFSPGTELGRRLCLGLPDGTALQCQDGRGDVVLRSLLLPPGDYEVALSGEPDEAVPYVLRIDETLAPAPDFELEPNDVPDVATPWQPLTLMRGRGANGEPDTFRLSVSGDAQIWEIRAVGPGVNQLSWLKADGRDLAREDVSGSGEAVLTDLYLTPGDQWFRVVATGEYRLEAVPLGPPDPAGEREPNDGAAFAEPYRLSREHVTGRLPRAGDMDVFRFSLAAPEHLILHLRPPADSAIDLSLESGGRVGERHAFGPGAPIDYDVFLPPGDYEVWLRTLSPSQERYTFSIERADPFSFPDDLEPNDTRESAAPLPETPIFEGSGDPRGDADWYRLPALPEGSIVRIRSSEAVSQVALEGATGPVPGILDHATNTFTSEPIPAGEDLALLMTAVGDYRATISAPGLVPAWRPGLIPVEATLSTDDPTEVAAYWPTGQIVEAELELRNDGQAALPVALDAVTSHFGWSAELGETAVEVPAGSSMVVPVVVTASPDAWADEPVRVSVRARLADGRLTTASLDMTPRREAPPVGLSQVWPVPEVLLGGLDVASLGLGAVTLPVTDPSLEDQLHDGLAHLGLGFWTDEAGLPLDLTVDLAGTDPVPVAGFMLDPQAQAAVPGDAPRHVEFQLSADGVTFETVLATEATPLMRDQAFVLDAPVPATHARLHIGSTWPGGSARVALGEWKVIAVPGTSPSGGPIDLGARIRGGHVAWMQPQQVDPSIPDTMLSDDLAPTTIYLDGGDPISWAMGFQDDRAALVEELGWIDPIPSARGQRIEQVEVDASLFGPAGPWQPLGTWRLERAADGTVAPFPLAEPTWVRALRFRGRAPGKAYVALELPASLPVIERATGDDYRSVLGEWGAASPAGPYEWLEPDLGRFAPIVDQDDDDSPDRARPLPPGSSASGELPDGTDVDWYAFTVPEDHNTVTIDAVGRPVLVLSMTLLDAEGYEVPLLFEAGRTPGSMRYRAEVTPGADYRMRVERPPSSIVFTYDTSASLGPYLDFVYQGLRAFTADVRTGEEAVQIIPFEEEPLLDDWSDDPYALQNAVDRFVLGGGSSSAESALIRAATELSARDGARAILLVTDAETSSYGRAEELWRILATARPLVSAVHVGATVYPATSRSFMQDWAVAAGGTYQYTRSHGEMDRAFDRLATWLRRPAGYDLALETEFLEKPPPSRKPGRLTVTSPPGGSAEATLSPSVGIELILDTSGSMLERIGGRRRIDVAREVLDDLIARRLPAGVNVALRSFGGRDACDTHLDVPLGPIDRASLRGLVRDLPVVQETNTPIGAALARVPSDLAGVEGTKIVLLITDGEETCGGDPAAAVRDLRRRGVDARVNLVGFALQDRRLKARMAAWARIGNGSYFDARSGAQLAKAVARAVSAPFRILDAAGNEVARGTVDGAPVPIEPGTYSVIVLTDPTIRFDGVEVEPGGKVALAMTPPAPAAGGEEPAGALDGATPGAEDRDG